MQICNLTPVTSMWETWIYSTDLYSPYRLVQYFIVRAENSDSYLLESKTQICTSYFVDLSGENKDPHYGPSFLNFIGFCGEMIPLS